MSAECKMGAQRLLLHFVFLCVTLASVDALLGERDETESFIRCAHGVNEQLVYGVQEDQNGARGKRQSGQQYQPFRIHIHYDSTVNTQLSTIQRNRLQNVIMPAVESNLEAALSVIPATSPILLDRDCVGRTFELPIGSVRQCSTQCSSQTLCVAVQVPEEHLKRCDQCNGNASNCETIGSNSPGVSNADYILYVGANSASPCGGSVLAFANLCQLESTLDRPIAGAINFCPSQFAVRSDDENIRIGIHEVVHALGFSPTAYPFFRDENGNPRTPRDQFGLPPTDATGRFVPSNTTIRTTTYPDWQTRNGPINHEVLQFVTPNVVEQAQIHYNCSTIEGVELENQGGGGTRSAHFEQRILGNEGMTGVLLFNIRFSRVTFGLMEDTGWYRANYGLAESLAWGQNTGCIIPHGSCGEWIETQQQKGATLAPYCNHLAQNPRRLGCTIDREFVSRCNLIDYRRRRMSIPSEFQYFNSGPNFNATVGPRAGGSQQTLDYCPYQYSTGVSLVCNQETHQPTTNLYAETYGPGSRCVEHGRQWFQTMSGTNSTSAVYGGGCYQYSCSVSMGVRIQVLGQWFQCSCEGEELILDIIGSGTRYQGSLICPSCGQLCFDDLSLCPNPEPAACYGRETFITVSITEPFTCYQDISSSGVCVNETGYTFSASDCCNGLGGGAYMQNNGSCVSCPRPQNATCRDGHVVCPMGRFNSSGRVDIYGERCINESFVCDGIQDCFGGTDEVDCGFVCNTGDLRLVGGSTELEGRVEVCYRNSWGTVCDDFWDFRDAEVVCRQLGLPTASSDSRVKATFGQGRGPIYLDNVHCWGTELRITNCARLAFGVHDCTHFQDAGVVCLDTFPCSEAEVLCPLGRDLTLPRERCIPESFVCDGVDDCVGGSDEENCSISGTPCATGDLRLVGGTTMEGRVELCSNGVWGTVCDDSWDIRHAVVVCRQLGLPTAAANVRFGAFFGEGTGRILLDDVICNGSESRLIDCEHCLLGQHNCQHSMDAGVICSDCEDGERTCPLGKINSFSSCIPESGVCDGIQDCVGGTDEVNCGPICNSGDVRLVGGDTELEGHVEVCFNNTWGTVCDDFWDDRHARVVCRQLGLPSTDAEFIGSGRFGQGRGKILLDDVSCNGDESRLTECRSLGIGVHNCRHSEDASVVCAGTPEPPTITTGTPPVVTVPPPSDPLEIHFANNTPHIVGNTVTVQVYTNKPASATCRLGRAATMPCPPGRATVFQNVPSGWYSLRVIATSDMEKEKVIWKVYVATTSICSVNLINAGLVVDGTIVSAEFQGVGSTSAFTCRLDHTRFSSCTSPLSYSGLTPGHHRIRILAKGCPQTQGQTFRFTV